MIDVERLDDATDPYQFDVRIHDDASQTTHRVTLPAKEHERIAPNHDPDALVEASMRFLLDREPKESILSSFEITTINRYFPGYEDTIHEYLDTPP